MARQEPSPGPSRYRGSKSRAEGRTTEQPFDVSRHRERGAVLEIWPDDLHTDRQPLLRATDRNHRRGKGCDGRNAIQPNKSRYGRLAPFDGIVRATKGSLWSWRIAGTTATGVSTASTS